MDKKVLILCTGNSCRSIIAEALINKELDGISAYSSGVKPSGRVHPDAKKILEENDAWRDEYHSKTLDTLDAINFDLIVTVCDHAKETCPIFPKEIKQMHVGFEDPDGKPYKAFEATFKEIQEILLPKVKSALIQKSVFKTDSGVKIAFTGDVAKEEIEAVLERSKVING